MKKVILLALVFSCLFCTLTSFSAKSHDVAIDQIPEEQVFTEAELAQMLAPIALYPDSLLTHILIASTYPIEVIEAHRWLQRNNDLSATQLAKSVEDFEWDASVKALVPFARILSRLSEDLSWTKQLGDAFLQDEERLLDSIQSLRKQAKHAGNLDKMENMEVSFADNSIIIEPREKEIVYVPYYDTRMVYGAWHWSAYPPVYWTPRRSVFVNHHRPFYWHAAIHISFDYFFSAFHWHNRHVVVLNTPRSHSVYRRYYHQRPRRLVASGGYAKRWVHQPKHRKGVAYRSKYLSQKYYTHRSKAHRSNKKMHQAHFNSNQKHRVKRHENRISSKIKHTSVKKALGTRKMADKQVRHLNKHRGAASNRVVKTKVPKSQKSASLHKHHNKGRSDNKVKKLQKSAVSKYRGNQAKKGAHTLYAKNNKVKQRTAKVVTKHKSTVTRKKQHRNNRKSNHRNSSVKQHK